MVITFAKAVLMILAVSLVHDKASAWEDSLQLEQAVLRQRTELRRGRVVFEVTRTVGGREKESRVEVVFDGSNIRTNVEQTLGHTLPNGETKESRDQYTYVYTPESHLFHTSFRTQPDRPVAAYLENLAKESGGKVVRGASAYRIDPRRLGIVPAGLGLLHSRRIEDILLRPDSGSPTTREEVVDGRMVWRIERPLKNGFKLTLDIDPARGPSVVSASLEFPGARGATIVDRIDSELAEFGSDRIWFPKIIRYARSVNGVQSSTSEFRILEAEFNKEIDPSSFTFAGMNLTPGTMVVEESPGEDQRMRFWDGTRLLTEAEARDQ